MAIKIVVDSASDISYEEAEKMGLVFLPLTVTFGDEEYKDTIDISHDEFYDRLENGPILPKTSQVTPFQYEQAFEKIVENGDIAIAITIASSFSGTYSSASIAADRFDDGKVYVVDSFSGSVGERILIEYALELLKTETNPEKIVSELNRVKEKIVVLFLLDTLEYLQKGGRISKMTSIAGALLSVKPILTVENKNLVLAGKARGFKKGNNLLREIAIDKGEFDGDKPFAVCYSGKSRELLDKYLEKYEEIFETKLDFIPVYQIGSSIGTHAGPNAVGLAFFVK
ncbi:DegV family protein [Peptostreptococcus russellii]|uniref:EDD domain protein, DegV family n=1 Tax=Peptostreptococcus russellii TaxID=215200 RepID=A0A1H8EVS4_9FIRM|nr:DegV family protein [Peptostreptococcus russellii]SEN23731.1 EDD domain protein, DegV family [Peptostreptococcus russellii]